MTMTESPSSARAHDPTHLSNQNQFAGFATKHHHISARHLLHQIHMPISHAQHVNQHITACFAHLKAQGYHNPILMAAIPFDTSQNGTLNFYGDFDQTTRTTTQHQINPNQITIINQHPLVQRQQFEHSVHLALNALASDQIQKIVLSQATEYELSQPQTAEQLFSTLLHQNPDAYNFMIPVEQQQYIFGASPELLLARQNQHIRSNPLAGSRPRANTLQQNNHAKAQLYASAKDRHEHQFVVDNIRQKLNDYCCELHISDTPNILETSTMLHLSSEFKGQLKAQAPNALNLALHLHPTPAVCGTPTTSAKQFILKHEGYNRHYYSGLNGWMDAEGNGEWVVTIRNGLLNANKIRLYAGAGIVKGSDATAEWLETEAKMQTMLNIFQLT